jgi:hypothetical protein
MRIYNAGTDEKANRVTLYLTSALYNFMASSLALVSHEIGQEGISFGELLVA